MNNATSLSTLFDQLGLKSDAISITEFASKHTVDDPKLPLYKASFWNPSQAEFLKEAIDSDSDWSTVVDELDRMLR
ncbi:MAG: DUF2789 family protein [Glaciecola sp.]|jgi:hypothetical protein